MWTTEKIAFSLKKRRFLSYMGITTAGQKTPKFNMTLNAFFLFV